MPADQFKPKKGGNGPSLISPATLAMLLAGKGSGIILDPTQFESVERAGQTYYRLRSREQFTPPRGGGGSGTGAFFHTYRHTNTHTYLQGGTVAGGNGGSATIEDIKIKDGTTGLGSFAGKRLYLQASCSATVADGLLLPGCLLVSATTVQTTGAIPANHTFAVSAATGDLCIELGHWTDTEFLPAGPPGNFLASGCIGNFSLSKVA